MLLTTTAESVCITATQIRRKLCGKCFTQTNPHLSQSNACTDLADMHMACLTGNGSGALPDENQLRAGKQADGSNSAAEAPDVQALMQAFQSLPKVRPVSQQI